MERGPEIQDRFAGRLRRPGRLRDNLLQNVENRLLLIGRQGRESSHEGLGQEHRLLGGERRQVIC
jgi:hypothetical protein